MFFFTPLGFCSYPLAQKGHLPIVQLLLEKGADIESTSSNGSTALYVASQKGTVTPNKISHDFRQYKRD